MKLLIETLWILFISFSVIIHNVTILPTMNGLPQFAMFIATMSISICLVYLLLYNHLKMFEQLGKEIKEKKC